MSARVNDSHKYLQLSTKEPSSTMSGKLISGILNRGTKVQEPAVKAYVQRLRNAQPGANPAEIITKLEKRYLATVMSSGAAVGAAAAFPGIGTITALSATAGESALFLEATALFTLALAAVHGIEVAESEHRQTLVLAVLLGNDGKVSVADVLGKKRTRGGGWLAEATSALPLPALGRLNAALLKRFARKFAIKRTAMAVGNVLPAGIGAIVGAGGNRFMGKRIVANARKAFGPPPTSWPVQLRLVASEQ